MKKSFGILKTNTGLTTNIKLVATSDNKLYLESFNSNSDLAGSNYKHVLVPDNSTWDNLIPFFWKNTIVDTAYDIKFDDDQEIISNDYSDQYEDLYLYGAASTEDTFYSEDFEYLAPLYFYPNQFPDAFIIFRVDGPGIVNMTADLFTDEILNQMKVVSFFDLSQQTKLGTLINDSFNTNNQFPISPIEFVFTGLDFTKYNGIDFTHGGYINKSINIDNVMNTEETYYDFDFYLNDAFRNNSVVFPNILNLKFLFNDTPATPTSLREWSINRYLGFYIDLDLVKTITPYTPPQLFNNIFIDIDNSFIDDNGNYIDPFVQGWIDNASYVEYQGIFYLVDQVLDISGAIKYKIMADINLTGQEAFLNIETITITNQTIINNINDSDFFANFDQADVWIISIDNKYWRLKKVDEFTLEIFSDYAFSLANNILVYYINNGDLAYSKSINLNLINDTNKPTQWAIYRVNFLDIKDFDNNIVNTRWSDFEYDLSDQIINTAEIKMYAQNYDLNENPPGLDTFVFNNSLVQIPTTSEYMATGELFRLNNTSDLTKLWTKSPNWSKWGYMNSNSHMDELYRMNNSLTAEDFNKSPNTYVSLPDRTERNLDYFYSVNPDSNTYIEYSLHVQGLTGQNNEIDFTYKFEFDKYFNTTASNWTSDYFTYFFSKKELLGEGSIIRNTNKFSTFLPQDGDSLSNHTLFKGIKFNLNKIVNIDAVNNIVNNITAAATNDFQDWKFSILLSDNDRDIDNGLTYSPNLMSWEIINDWQLGKAFNQYDVVNYYSILYEKTSVGDTIISDPLINPGNSTDYDIITYSSTFSTILWSSTKTYATGSIYVVYYEDEYYELSGGTNSGLIDFWSSNELYSPGSYAFFSDTIWTTMATSSIGISPLHDTINWIEETILTIENDFRWSLIPLWSNLNTYNANEFSIYNDTVYESTMPSNLNNLPTSQTWWSYVYSLDPNTDYVYQNTPTYGLTGIIAGASASNNLIYFNNRYYLNTSNTLNQTLDNGIDIFINKKWQNVLVNIYINDNTLPWLQGVNRDDIYTEMFGLITAQNFISSLNNINNPNGFVNPINYYIIEEDLTYNKYNLTNIRNLPYILIANGPDQLQLNFDTNIITTQSPNQNLVKLTNTLQYNEIPDLSQKDYYNLKSPGLVFNINTAGRTITDNIHGLQNITYVYIYRHSGYYMPIFKTIDLFKKIEDTNSLIGNYLFDTNLSRFGLMEERIYTKVNPLQPVLKLQTVDNERSVYPMIDEFGYSYNNFFIFKSNWDTNYYWNVVTPLLNATLTSALTIISNIPLNAKN